MMQAGLAEMSKGGPAGANARRTRPRILFPDLASGDRLFSSTTFFSPTNGGVSMKGGGGKGREGVKRVRGGDMEGRASYRYDIDIRMQRFYFGTGSRLTRVGCGSGK